MLSYTYLDVPEIFLSKTDIFLMLAIHNATLCDATKRLLLLSGSVLDVEDEGIPDEIEPRGPPVVEAKLCCITAFQVCNISM